MNLVISLYFISSHLVLGDSSARCRWSPIIGESYLFVKYSRRQLNILDAEKKMLALKRPIQLERSSNCLISIWFQYPVTLFFLFLMKFFRAFHYIWNLVSSSLFMLFTRKSILSDSKNGVKGNESQVKLIRLLNCKIRFWYNHSVLFEG